MRAGLLAIIHHHCKVGNLTETKMDVQPAAPIACMKMELIMVSLQTSNLFLDKCLSTLQTVPWVKFRFFVYGENYRHDKHFLKGKLADDAKREHWRSLRINVLSRLIIDAINRKSVGASILIIFYWHHATYHFFINSRRGPVDGN